MAKDVKEAVKSKYGQIAQNSGSCCCSSSCCSDVSVSAEEIGYDASDLSKVPDGANLGLGCGNPLGIASIKEGETVLDLGSGAGFDVFLAAQRVGQNGRVIGLDMTPEMIEAASKNAAKGGYSNVEFRLGDIEDMPIESNSIDLIISNCVLNLVPNKQRAFAEIVRVLKPGGRISISDMVLDGDLPKHLKEDVDAYCSCISGAIRREEYIQSLSDAGLVDIEVVSESKRTPKYSGEEDAVTSVTITARKPKCCEV